MPVSSRASSPSARSPRPVRPPRSPRRIRAALLEALEDRRLYHAGHDEPPVTDPTPPTTPPATHLPHADNPTLQAEHLAVMALVPTDQANYTVVASGAFSDASIWLDGAVPQEGAQIWLPKDLTLTVDFVSSTSFHWLRADGHLRFDTRQDTGLLVETLVVSPTGSLEMGSAADPIAPGVLSKVIFADRGPLDAADVKQFGRGLISHGDVSVFGAHVTPYVTLLGQGERKGATTLTLDQAPENWAPGDRLVLTGTNPWSDKDDEEFAIVSVADNVVTLDKPLAFNHLTPDPRFKVYLTNVSRNAVFESQNPQVVAQRGHVMFMHSDDVHIENAGFYGLGRTDKRTPIDDPEILPDGTVEPHTGLNPRGRYAVHFHRTGLTDPAHPAVLRGSSIVDSPGWGAVNHSSNVLMEDNVSFDVIGAHFATEAGDEIGAFRRNLAIKSAGSGDGVESRDDEQDFGHQGDGFWFQGAGVEVEGNIAVSQKHAGFIYFTKGLEEKGLGTAKFKSANLADPSLATEDTIDVGKVPIAKFQDNLAFGNDVGFETWFHLRDAGHAGRSVVDHFTAWGNRGRGANNPYTHNLTFRDSTFYRNLNSPGDTALTGNDVTKNIRYENLTVEGWGTGISLPRNGTNVVQDGTYTNIVNLEIRTAGDITRTIEVNGNVDFRSPSAEALKDKTHWNLYLRADFNPKHNDITRLFNPDIVRLGLLTLNGKQVYYQEQDADFVPFPKKEFTVQGKKAVQKITYDADGKPIAPDAAPYVPPELYNKTNAQIFSKYGLTIGGTVAPKDAVQVAGINGVVGEPAAYNPALYLKSDKYSNNVSNYLLQYKKADGTKVKETLPTKLRQGWNLLTRTIDGATRTLLVYGDTINPTFQLDPNTPLILNPADLKRALTLQGTIYDDSFGQMNYKTKLTDLNKLPVQTAPDGKQFIVITFKVQDLAKNSIIVSATVTLDPNAPLVRDLKRKDTPPRVLSGTLLALLGFREDKA